MKILKFGGTSVGSAERIKSLVPLIRNAGEKIVVLSAMSGTTNMLVDISQLLHNKDSSKAKILINQLEQKYEETVSSLFTTATAKQEGADLIRTHFDFIRSFTLDLFTINEEKSILAQGELISTALLHFYLKENNIRSKLLPALQFMRIDENGEPDLVAIEKNLKHELQLHPGESLYITQGYICRNPFGEIDNLQRGGSDYTATLIGAAIGATEIQIWTDIDGMHNNDPRIVPGTFPVNELSFDEAAELAYFGAKILHPTCVLPAQKKNIPVRLLNTMDPQAKGTLITGNIQHDRITAVAAKDGIVSINIKSTRMLLAYGFLRNVFELFERYKTPIDMITTSEVAISVTIDKKDNLEPILAELKEFCSVNVEHNLSIICIAGSFKAEKQGIAGKIFDSLKTIPIRMISYGASENNISLLVNTTHKNEALLALNTGLFKQQA